MSWDQIGEMDPDTRHPMTPRASNPKARPRDMDAMGVDQALLYPTWFAEGFHLIEDPDVAYRLACAYNDWIADCCKAAPHRLFAVAMVPLQNMDYALEELRRVRAIEAFRAHLSGRCSSKAAILLIFGYVMAFRNPRELSKLSDPDFYPAMFDQIEYLDRVGFDTIWTTEHHFTDDGYLAAVMPMMAEV